MLFGGVGVRAHPRSPPAAVSPRDGLDELSGGHVPETAAPVADPHASMRSDASVGNLGSGNFSGPSSPEGIRSPSSRTWTAQGGSVVALRREEGTGPSAHLVTR
ncbi:hypothetical protein GCM10010405_44430 [Streptomyces macrosporus]|uniref:Uncharacterized protein n=1 Tax=Streptomyces macrosporus TaxID=44032 RepID=A0ABN3KC58_9ACTN